ncbi:glycosyltransferase family 2 protein [uncultured Bacteroides sp.]|uniref:glycosyltransferase family 2 protein n=1 Tax=uncultured Bacteroides sp. TaxID=162156 RepID=UPI00266EB9B4|nr:glycosyltransferase family 2 protein [uncultured Bacteroides sp.]
MSATNPNSIFGGKYLVSIIIPAYNVEKYIEECVLSVTKQSYANIEILVVDDGSSDNTPTIIDRLAVLDKRVVVIHQKNAGVSAARNTGIDVSKGEYVVFVDGDDYIAPDFVEYLLGIVETTGAELCLSLDSFTKKGERQVQNEYIEILSPQKATALLLSPRIIVGSWNKIYKKSVLQKNNLRFSSHLFYGEGLFFYTTFSQLCTKVGIGNRKVYYYRRDNYESATTRFNINALINGDLAIDEIRENLKIHTPCIDLMLDLHKCLFNMGAVVRIKANHKEKEYVQEYRKFKSYLHKNTLKLLFKRKVPLYRKGLLLGTCINPSFMAWLDSLRRKHIAANSVK